MHPISLWLYVCDCWNDCVQVFGDDGLFLFRFETGRSWEPRELAIDSHTESVYVTGRSVGGINVFSTRGEYRCQIGVNDVPYHYIAVHPMTLHVIAWNMMRRELHVYTPDGQRVQIIFGDMICLLPLGSTHRIAVIDPAGDVYVKMLA